MEEDFCELKRAAHEKWVNNYCPEVLEFWEGNMNIQPCGSNEALAHYVTKYIAKVEPEDLNEGVYRIRQEESDIQRNLFKICMRILKERQVSACISLMPSSSSLWLKKILLVQYVPFDKESELLERYPNSRDAFLDREKKFFGDENPFLSSIRERSNQLENAFCQAQALEILQNPKDYVPEEIPEEVPILNMMDEQFRDAQNAMNEQQRELLNIITRGIENQMRRDSSRFLIFVTGVGKTFTFNTLKEKVNRIYENNVVKVAALTGVAAILVGGSTLHSMFNFQLNEIEKHGSIDRSILGSFKQQMA
ncbi:ATP-dependent DNA helicase [Nephila pilipes]|uniref:ATP-dependent DNA helicase n=1 Tax=Nephila pilipes TaxID=299642 RepID=A0A8X6PUB9_NEPPI|nr:ATP-dependent DNA helicase [Nephila pilipes]